MNQPLSHVTVLDFTWAGVGPYATFLLGLPGARCIKVETAAHESSPGKGSNPVRRRKGGISYYNELNVNKLCVTLNLKHPDGIALARRLAGLSDVVADNFRPGVMDRLGLGYKDLCKVRPDIIVAGMSANGATGPDRAGAGFASVFAAFSGVSLITGYPGGPPVEMRFPMDMVAGASAAFAIMAALWHRDQSGQGQSIDCSNREALSGFMGEVLLDYLWNGRDQGRRGNRHEAMAPHNCYPCKGPSTGSGQADQWASIAVATDDEWRALCRATGHEAWLADERFADAYQRWKHVDSIDQGLASWTRQFSPYEVMDILQKAGIAAAPSLSAADVLADPHLHARDSWVVGDDREGGQWLMFGAPWRLHDTPGSVRAPSPQLGEHNALVFGEMLGLREPEMADLRAKGAIG